METKITKNSILKQLNIWNETKIIHGVIVARVAFRENSWRVLEKNDFKSAIENPMEQFYYQKELADYILQNYKKNK